MTRSTYSAAASVAVILILCLASMARAAVPASLNYQGFLTDAAGLPVNDSVVVTFSIYTTIDADTAVWSDDLLVTVDQGLFSVELGSDGTFPPGMFDTPLYLGVTIAGDTEMLPRRPLTSVGFSFKADDAWSLRGQGPAVFDQSGHVADTDNPHWVTAAQTGAASAVDIAELQSQLDAALATIAALEADLSNSIATLQADLAAETTARINAVSDEAAARASVDVVHDTAITSIQSNSVLALDGVLTLSGGDTALFDGVNLQVVNGTGDTWRTNGLGNVIVGYNTIDADPEICSLGAYDNQDDCLAIPDAIWASNHKSGSHNVVIGDEHNYSRFASLVVGYDNNITGVATSVIGGTENTAGGAASSVSGGRNNSASGLWASISGGYANNAGGEYSSASGGDSNDALGDYSSVSGGFFNRAMGRGSSVSSGADNTAGGDYSSVSGGVNNEATGGYSSVSGGGGHTASGSYSSVSGGTVNTASGDAASVIGGRFNTASGDYSSVAGGGGLSSSDGNEAFADFSAILGGRSNVTGDPTLSDNTIGLASTVSGGRSNSASGTEASVSGGVGNSASGSIASVSGGSSNTASGLSSSVSGGYSNTASGHSSSVAGGGDWDSGNEAFADFSAILGGRGNVTGDPVSGDNEIGVASTVGGGLNNNAQGLHASVSGGQGNSASGTEASVSGGVGNIASGNNAAVSGGMDNIANGFNASVTGGQENIASGTEASVSGGALNEATGNNASVSGGRFNTASGQHSSVSGGNDHESSDTDDWRAGSLFQDD